MEKKIIRIGQIGIIVRDLRKAVQFYKTTLGIEKWDFFDSNHDMPEMLINGKDGKLNIIGAIATDFSPFEIELIQPVGNGIYHDFLEENGPGLHHMAVITKDHCSMEIFDGFLEDARKSGNKILLHSKFKNAPLREGMDVAYLDYREEAGTILEVYNEERE